MKKIKIALTGATGLLGRNLLFEVMKQNINNLENIIVYILGRDKSDKNIQDRIRSIIIDDGLEYIGKNFDSNIQNFIELNIKCISIDLTKEKLNLSNDDFKKLKNVTLDYFFHIAALTDFRSGPNVIKALKATNVVGTQKILELVSTLNIKEFCYVGSAYCCGNVSGNISPDYINVSNSFRNPYEKTKLEAEKLVRVFSKKTGLKCRFFRPSTISGRLLEEEKGSICKFDVFYSWGAWFLRHKYKILGVDVGNMTKSFDMNMQITFNFKGGLNIVPADFAAKVIYNACFLDYKEKNYYLVNNQETSHSFYLLKLLENFRIKGVSCGENEPKNKNKLEKFYYKTVGGIYTPYISSNPMLFNIDNLQELYLKGNLECPKINDDNYKILLSFANKYNYGL